MIYHVFIPIALTVVPWMLVRFAFTTPQTRKLPYRKLSLYLWLAAYFWIFALSLPAIPISHETTTFTMHFTGGVVAAILFEYFTKAYQLKFTAIWQQLVLLYLVVSGLGVLNELFEFYLNWSGLDPQSAADTWWDLYANTLGGFLGFGVFRLVAFIRVKAR